VSSHSIRCIFITSLILSPVGALAQDAARVWDSTLTLPTYEEGLPNPNPPFDFFAPRRINYPYTIRDNLTDRRVPRAWRALYLENEYLRCVVLPDLGGHIYSCTDKTNGAEVFYANPSIKLTQIGYRGAWAALGVEFNFPVSHNWMSTSPIDFATTTGPDGSVSAWIGNIDRVYGTHWRVQLTLRPGRAVLEQHTTLYNRSDVRHRFYWWTNAAVEVWDDSRIIYPMEFTASHGFRDIDTWPVDSRGTDNSVVGNHMFGPVSRFSHGSREPYMAVYHPRTAAGVVHYSAPRDLPAKKVWSWGGNANGLRWREALSDNSSAYVEIQRGLFRNQETYGFLDPQEEVRFSEYWIPIRDLGWVSRANPDAAVSMARVATDPAALDVALNVTRVLPNAAVVLHDGSRRDTVHHGRLHPAVTFTTRYDVLPGRSYTVDVYDAGGRLLLSHTEDQYDYTPADEITVGPVPEYSYPPVSERSEGDFLMLGDAQEREGRRLEALTTYRQGLVRFPGSLPLRKASGRLKVALKQYASAVEDLSAVRKRVSNDYETAYYLGHAFAAVGDSSKARLAWEAAQNFGTYRSAATLALVALAARAGDKEGAVEVLQRLTAEGPRLVRAGALEVTLLRSLNRTAEARERLGYWRDVDPTNSFLRYEATRLGEGDEALWYRLAADPERILEITSEYLSLGLYDEAVTLLDREYPSGAGVVSEPGMPHPESYPLIAYYRGYARSARGENAGADFARASRMPTRYVFPNRRGSIDVLRRALEHNPDDATAHFLMGSLHLSSGVADSALSQWEAARRLNPVIPGLHYNLGYALLHSGGPAERAAQLFAEGTSVDGDNVGLYFGLDEALTRAGRSASERADAMLSHPDRDAMPAALVYQLARTLTDAERFDEAEALFVGRFFPSEEGGINVREVYLEVRVGRAQMLAAGGDCREALDIVEHLNDRVPDLAFTQDGLEDFIESERFQEMVGVVRGTCRH
jgi:tetratricopeptide (TPR) repeat protein